MSTTIPSQPYAAAIFADCLFDTNLLPASITGSNSVVYTKSITGSTNGANWIYSDPEDEAAFIVNINTFFSGNAYGSGFGGYNCTGVNAAVKPCRYVVMHRTNQVPSQGAHQLLVDAAGNYTFINTTWTATA